MTKTKVKGHTRTLKSGKTIKVKGYERKIKTVSFPRAERHFKKLPKKTRQLDQQSTAKKLVRTDRIPKSYIRKGGTKQMDVAFLDTPVYSYGQRVVKLNSVYQIRRIQKPEEVAASGKGHYETHTKLDLNQLKDSDVRGLFIETNIYSKFRMVDQFKGKLYNDTSVQQGKIFVQTKNVWIMKGVDDKGRSGYFMASYKGRPIASHKESHVKYDKRVMTLEQAKRQKEVEIENIKLMEEFEERRLKKKKEERAEKQRLKKLEKKK